MILLISPKNIYATKRLIEEAKKAEIPLEVLSMEELAAANFAIDVKKYRTFFIRSPFVNASPKYFPQIIAFAKKFKDAGKRIVDGAIAEGELGEGKMADYVHLTKAGLPIPKTSPLPSPPHQGEGKNEFLPLEGGGKVGVILKWQYGFKGKHVFLVKNKNQFQTIVKKYPKGELLAQEFIDADYEYKVITVGYKALPVVLRFDINKKTHWPDFGKFDVLRWRHPERSEGSQSKKEILRRFASQNDAVKEVVSLAERASKLLKRELSKVDILQKGNKLYILEVNRWPGLKSFEELTGYNVAEKFIKYLSKSN